MANQIELLTGIAGTGKTNLLLSEYRAALTQLQPRRQADGTLWIAPTQRVKRALLQSLLNAELPVCWSPNILTFDEFAERVLHASNYEFALIRDAAKRRLVRLIIESLDREKRIPYFSRISRTTGFLDLAIGFITELKRSEIWPEHFVEACKHRGNQVKDRELALIYERYQQQLHNLQLYDAEGRFWLARTALEDGFTGPFKNLQLTVIDGFTDFTRPQHDILRQLAAISDRMVIGLQCESPLTREDLFAKTNQVRSILSSEPTVTTTHHALDSPPTGTGPTKVISEHLFQTSASNFVSSESDGLEILSATAELGEVQAIAVRVKELVNRGVPCEEIVIAYRNPTRYAPLIDEVFSSSGIPLAMDYGKPLSQLPVVKTIVQLLQLEVDDWAFQSLMRILSSHFFRPDWPQWNPDQSARDVASALRTRRLFSNREVILEQIERPFRVDEDSNSDDASKYESTRQSAAPILVRLAEQTERLRARHDFQTWVHITISMGRELRFDCANIDQESSEQDQSDWELFERVLHDAVLVETSIDGQFPEIDVTEFLRQLVDLLQSQTTQNKINESGRVRALEVSQVRNLDIPYLFIIGLTENQFPQIRHDDCLYNDHERRQLIRAGLGIHDVISQSQDEMLLFYGIVTRATKRLFLSYPSESSTGQLLFPSPYLTALQELFDPEWLAVRHHSSLDPVPIPERVISPSDLRIAATESALHNEPQLFSRLFEHAEIADAARNVLSGITAVTNRFAVDGMTNFEGRLENTANVAWLSKRFSDDHEYSATQLESFARCPFRWLLSDVLGIRPIESADFVTDTRLRGIIVHNILAKLHEEERQGTLCLDPQDPEPLKQRFIEIAEELLRRQSSGTEVEQALIELERRALVEMATQYANQWMLYVNSFSDVWDQQPEPFALEFDFGQDSEHPALEVNADHPIRVAGRIDRIDIGSVQGNPVFNLIDYKTGRIYPFEIDDIASGRNLQLALYGLAIQRLGIAQAQPFQLAYWELKDRGFTTGVKKARKRTPSAMETEFVTAATNALQDTIPALVANLRSGAFPVINEDENCTRFCEFHTVCRVREMRKVAAMRNKQFQVSQPNQQIDESCD